MATVLTNETFNEYITTGLAFELLPKTFQNAVLFTRSLGKRYLWIDSLCIIQNNADDWDREAAIMCSVYQGALLTIAAASSSSGRGGLLYEPPTHRITRTTPNGPYTLFGRESIRHKEKEYPLLTRGWAFQERLLSPRTLYFGSKELLWECRGSRTCQCGESVSSHIGGDVSKVYQTTTAGAASLDGGRLISQWHRLVSRFSQLRLSYEKDVLPATSGPAAQVTEIRRLREPTTYHAGLWSNSFEADLLWYRDRGWEHDQRASRPVSYRAPTWSWASVNGPISWIEGFMGCKAEENFEVLHIPKSSELDGQPGPVSHLILKGMAVCLPM